MSGRARAMTIAAAVGVGAYVAREVGQRVYDRVYPARAHVRDTQRAMGSERTRTHQNLMSLIRLRGARMEADAAGGGGAFAATDVIVHGTSLAGNNTAVPDWARPDSTFATRIRNGGGGHARDAVTTSFLWSGSGDEMERQRAGSALSRFITDTQRATIAGGRSTNAIAHSHGGNVLGHAMSHAGTHIDNAVLLGTPAMRSWLNPNVSWTAAGTDRVGGGIYNYSSPQDTVQTTMAQGNEWARGYRGVRSGREFSRPGSTTPQHNVTVNQRAGWRQWGMGLLRDAGLVGMRHQARQGRIGGAMAGGGVALVGGAGAGAEAHTAMHSDAMGSAVGRRLGRIESPLGQLNQAASRLVNTLAGRTAARNERLDIP